MRSFLAGLALGVLAGALGVVVHGGFVDAPVFGLVLGVLVVASGAWCAFEWCGRLGWLAALLAIAGVTVFFLLLPHGSDVLVSPTPWISRAWLVLAPLSAVVPGLLAARVERKAEVDAVEVEAADAEAAAVRESGPA